MNSLIIFDFDGVIADSEYLANVLLAEIVTELGKPTSVEDCYRLYMGQRFEEIIVSIENSIGRPVSNNFPGEYQQRTLNLFRQKLQAVDGAREYIEHFKHIPQCIASSSSPDRLAACLDILKLKDLFDQSVYSASLVENGKPHPDIFLYAADHMGVDPSNCLVIEDSPSGVKAGVAAGMSVIGLTAASHIQSGHSERLLAAGAHSVAATFEDVKTLTGKFLNNNQ